MRLLLSESEHQFVNIAMAGVRSPRASGKQGEMSEQYGEEVIGVHALRFQSRDADGLYVGVGQILYGVEVASATPPSHPSLHTAIDRHSIPSRFVRRSRPSDDLDRQR